MSNCSNDSIGIKDLSAIIHLTLCKLEFYAPTVRAKLLEKDFTVDILNLYCTIVPDERVVCLMSVSNDIASSVDFPSIVYFRRVQSAISSPMLRLKRDVGELVFDLIQRVT